MRLRPITIKSKFGNYQIKFTQSPNFIDEFNSENCLFCLDENVYRLYKKSFFKKITGKTLLLLKPQEKTKTLQYAKNIYGFILKKNAKRNLILVAIGGGIVQDVVGFAASTIYRGIRWIYTPTTLLAQTDSCIGGKTSLNFSSYKNIIGTFYPPKQIYINYKFLETLSKNDFYSGLGELIKIQLAGTNRKNIKGLAAKIAKVFAHRSSTDLTKLIYSSLIIKKKFIETDEFDLGKRTLLNYGHTLGHALESESGFTLPHGSAITIGMIFANILSLKRNLIDKEIFDYINEFLLFPCLTHLKLSNRFFKKSLLTIVKQDKKMTADDLTFIVFQKDLRLVKISNIKHDEFYKALNYLQNILKFRSK